MNNEQRQQYIKTIRSGDLLAWSESHNKKWYAALGTFIIRLFTLSEYSHVGVAFVENDELYVLAASPKYIRKLKLTEEDSFYHIPMYLDWTDEQANFLFSKIGLPYSFWDCVRAYFGSTTNDNDTWQCAELASAFYAFCKVELGEFRKTPASLVRAIEENMLAPITKVPRG